MTAKLYSLEQTLGRKSIVNVGPVRFGRDFVLIAGPCSVETEKQTILTAQAVKAAGGHMLRGGVFKPRTSPYAFQGLGMAGLKILAKAKAETGLPVVTEVLDPRDAGPIAEYADMLQVGARNMQNASLLKEAGKIGKPVLLKRGMNSTLIEWLNSAECVLSEGNPGVVLCERGIRTFETYTRNTLDLSMVPAVGELSHLPVVVDPSHGTGKTGLIDAMSLAAVAAGADGLMLEVHYKPEEALSDKDQTLSPEAFSRTAERIFALSSFMSRLRPSSTQGSPPGVRLRATNKEGDKHDLSR